MAQRAAMTSVSVALGQTLVYSCKETRDRANFSCGVPAYPSVTGSHCVYSSGAKFTNDLKIYLTIIFKLMTIS